MGSIVIHWQERYRDSDGHYRTVTRSQTLTASITRPAPSYQHNTYLIYGNDAAPTLTFSRSPSNIEGMDEKDIEKKVKSEVKKLDDKAKDAIKNNQNFVRLGNDEFEVLFGGENRNNEIEFRLLFTPLAQKNELDLIKNKTGFGDDFYFQKNGRINVIRTKHSQNQNYECNPNIFINNSYYGARNFFIDYQDQYFKSLFYDLAPLISIPLYQQYKPKEYIYQREYPSNITSFEHESLANSFPIDVLKHPASDTNVILKTKFIQKDKESDRVNICAYSFKIVHRIENVPRHGGDGRVHLVPVPYDEYIPLTKETIMEVKQEQRSRKEINDLQNNGSFSDFIQKLSGGNHFIYERGLLATLMFRDVLESDIDKWNSYFKNVNSNIQNNNNKGD